jgi:hypothetical protein
MVLAGFPTPTRASSRAGISCFQKNGRRKPIPELDSILRLVQTFRMRPFTLLLLAAMLTLSAAAEEVRRLRLPSARTEDTVLILRRLLPAGNYAFGRDGSCYVAGAPDDLDALSFPADFPAVWEPLDLETQQFPLVGGCRFEQDQQVIESVPVTKIIGYLTSLYPQVVFVPGFEGRWQVVGDAESVEAACQAAEHLPETVPAPPTEMELIIPLYDNAFSQGGAFQESTAIVGAKTFPEDIPTKLADRLLFRY